MAKKPYIDRENPAFSFLSTVGIENAEPDTAAPAEPKNTPEGYRVNPQYIEKKTRRLQLVLQPSLYEKVKAKAERSGTSVNDYIHSLLEEDTREE